MQTWFDMAKTTKATNGTLFMVYNGDKNGQYGEGEHAGWFDGQSQPGEYEYAREIGCTKIEWVPYYAHQALHRQAHRRFAWPRQPLGAAMIRTSLIARQSQNSDSEVELDSVQFASLEKWKRAQLANLQFMPPPAGAAVNDGDLEDGAAVAAASCERVGSARSCAGGKSGQVRFSPSTKL